MRENAPVESARPKDETLDALGLLCPAPIIRTAKRMKALPIGAVLEVLCDDRGIEHDMPAWCRSHGQEYLGFEKEGSIYRVYVRRAK